MKKNHQQLLALFDKLSYQGQQNVMQFIQYLEHTEKEQLRVARETRYLAHIEESKGIFLIEDELG